MLWIYDDNFKEPTYAYTNSPDEPLKIHNKGTYTDRDAPIEAVEYSWNHSLGNVVNALIEEGLTIEFLHEHMSSPYNIFPRPHIVEHDYSLFQKGYQIEGLENRIPMIFSLRAKKNS